MLTKLKLAMLISAPLVAGATTYALAQGDGLKDRPRQELLHKFDKNADGKLDDAERADLKAAFAARRAEHHKEMIAQYDTNQDGKLDATERAAMRDGKLTERFQKMDANGDGKLTLDEFKAAAGKRGAFHHGRHGHRHLRSKAAGQGV